MPTTNHNVASAIRAVAKEIAAQWKRGERASDLDLHDLVEILGKLADRIAK